MNRSDSITNLAAALCKAQGKMGIAIKDKTNPAFRSKYADLGAVWEAARPALQEHGLALVQLPLADEPGYASLETVILHESGEYLSSISRSRIVKDDPQGYGSAITFLKRYSMSAALGIVSDEDDDGQAASAPRPAQKAQQAAPRTQSAPPASEQPTPPWQASPAPAPAKPPSGPTLSNGQAATLHARLGAILKGTEWDGMDKDFASDVLGFKVGSFADLTMAEAKRLVDAAEGVPKVQPQEGAA